MEKRENKKAEKIAYVYRIDGFTIKKIPKHMWYSKIIEDLFGDSYKMQIKVLYLKKFWKGFIYQFDVDESIYRLVNYARFLKEDIECLDMYLDDFGIPREEGPNKFSMVGRVKLLMNKNGQ